MTSRQTVRLFSWGFVFLCLVALLAGWWQRYAVYDWWRLRSYTPNAQITKLADETTMYGSSRRMFYANQPVIEPQASFNTHCTDSEETIVLGCYIRTKGIYLFDVKDERLQGIMQVTAAHEMLHAGYDRLSSGERKRVNTLLEQAYAKITNQRIRSTIDQYRANGADVPNEMHSILGTEVRDLPPELEDYYKRYFTDRLQVVGFSEKYEKEFSVRQEKVNAYDAQLADLKKQIDSSNGALNTKIETINSEYERLQQLRSSGQVSAFNAGVSPYNQLVSSYNAEVKQAQDLINRFNTLVAERNAISVEENELIKAIDSRPNTIDTQ